MFTTRTMNIKSTCPVGISVITSRFGETDIIKQMEYVEG